MSPYRTPIDDDRPPDEPPIDPVAHRVLSWLGGGFHLLGALALAIGTWLIALTGTSIMAYHASTELGPARFDATPFAVAGMTVVVLVGAHAARIVATDVWDGRHLVRCRVALPARAPARWSARGDRRCLRARRARGAAVPAPLHELSARALR